MPHADSVDAAEEELDPEAGVCDECIKCQAKIYDLGIFVLQMGGLW